MESREMTADNTMNTAEGNISPRMLNQALEHIFIGYFLIFANIEIIRIDILPDVVGYYLICRGWDVLARCQGARALGYVERGWGCCLLLGIASLVQMVVHFLSGGADAGFSIFDVELPTDPQLFQFRPAVLLSIALFLVGIYLMLLILRAAANLAESEDRHMLANTIGRYCCLLKWLYAPVCSVMIAVEACVSFPGNTWGNLAQGCLNLMSLIYFCFQLLLILQIANLRKNLRCCQEEAH